MRCGSRDWTVFFVTAFCAVFMISCGSSTDQPTATPEGAAQAPPANVADRPPVIGTVTPQDGRGTTATFRVSVSHPGGADMIKDVQVLINNVLPGPGQTACWIDINGGKTVAAKKEDGSTFFEPAAIGSAKTVSNSKCSVRAAEVKVEASGEELTITLPVTFSANFKGPKRVWAIASGPSQHSGWQQRAAWLVD